VTELAGMSLTVQQALLGSCTNARVEDIAVAAGMLRGRKVHADVRMIVTPASSEVWRDCARLGYWEILADAGAMVTTAGCGAFPGGDGGWHTEHGIPRGQSRRRSCRLVEATGDSLPGGRLTSCSIERTTGFEPATLTLAR
jgi:aconitase A